MSTLIARLIVKIITWARYKTHTYNISKFTGISQKATIGINCILNISPKNLFIGDYTYLNEVHLSSGERAKVIIGQGCAIGYNISIKAITLSKEKPTNNNLFILEFLQKIFLSDFFINRIRCQFGECFLYRKLD